MIVRKDGSDHSAAKSLIHIQLYIYDVHRVYSDLDNLSRLNHSQIQLQYKNYSDVIMSMMASQMKKTLKLRFIGLCAGNSPMTGEFLAQRASNAENLTTSSSDQIMRWISPCYMLIVGYYVLLHCVCIPTPIIQSTRANNYAGSMVYYTLAVFQGLWLPTLVLLCPQATARHVSENACSHGRQYIDRL